MSDLSKLYKKTGLRKFVEDWKRPALGAAAGLAAGAIPGAFGGVINPMTMAALGLGGAAMGYDRTKQKKEGEKAAAFAAAQQAAKDQAGNDLDTYLDDIIGGGTQPPPPGTTGPMPGENIHPQFNPPTTNTPIPAASQAGGLVPNNGSASADAQKLLAEAEFQRQQQMTGQTDRATQRQQYLDELAGMLNQQSERQFTESLPGMYEDLNTRGLLRSSALGDRMSTEKAKMAAKVQEQIAMQGLQDRMAGVGEMGGIEDQYLKSRYGAINRQMSLEDFVRQTEASKLLGMATAPITPAVPSGKGSAGLQTGLGVASGVAGLFR